MKISRSVHFLVSLFPIPTPIRIKAGHERPLATWNNPFVTQAIIIPVNHGSDFPA